MAVWVLPMGRQISLMWCQRAGEASHEFSQPGAHLPARVVVHIAPGEEQQVYPSGRAELLCEDLSRDTANATPRRGTAGRPPQRHNQSPRAMRRPIPACGPRTRAYPDPASPQSSGGSVGKAPACHFIGLHCEPAAALCATSLQDLAAIRRAHPLEKAVATLALALVGLICSFHGSSQRWRQDADNMACAIGLSSLARGRKRPDLNCYHWLTTSGLAKGSRSL